MDSTFRRDYFPRRAAERPLKPSEVVPTATYMERGQRWMEKEEAFSLHEAMAAKQATEEAKHAPHPKEDAETRIHNAALNEAAELVWQHFDCRTFRSDDSQVDFPCSVEVMPTMALCR